MHRGLYIHIPFCEKKCHYCNYVITTQHQDSQRELFFESLFKQMTFVAKKHGSLKFETIYFGGGTPSLLTVSEMKKIFSQIHQCFDISDNAEITCEMNPGDLDEAKIRFFYEMGINRISLGVQSFNDNLLRHMGRVHDSKACHQTLYLLRKIGFKNISVDLIIRLPNQTLDDIFSSLKEAVSLGADQIVIYDLNIHQETTYGKLMQSGKLVLPIEEEHLKMFEAIEEVLTRQNDFVQYEISSFAKPGFESKHNLIYWSNGEYLGLGPGAYSYMNGIRSTFAQTVNRYLKKCEEENWLDDDSEKITNEKNEMETFLTGLRLKQGVYWKKFKHIESHLSQEIPRLIHQGLLVEENERIYLSRKGKQLAESVFTELSLSA